MMHAQAPSSPASLPMSLVKAFLLFMVFSFVGWCYEIGNDLVVQGGFHPRASFAGPWCPIYGIGGLLILLCFKPVRARIEGRCPKVAEVLAIAKGQVRSAKAQGATSREW